MHTSDRFYDPDRVLTAAMHAVEIARNHDRLEIEPDDLLAGLLLAVSRFGIVEFGDRALDLGSLDLPFDLPAPETTLRPRYSTATADLFTRAARICRSDGGGPLRPIHLLVALGDASWPRMRRIFEALALDARGWRRLLAAIEPATMSLTRAPDSSPLATRSDDLLSPEQAAAELGVHIQTLRGYIRRGKLPAFRLAGERVIRIRRDDLAALLAQPVDPGGVPTAPR
jgi:excisionase family DNA binding protein